MQAFNICLGDPVSRTLSGTRAIAETAELIPASWQPPQHPACVRRWGATGGLMGR